MSEHQALGLTINVYKPAFGPYVPRAYYIGAFPCERYEHAITTGIGFDSMTCSKTVSMEEAYWWLANACGAHAEVVDETDVCAWEGRVNTVALVSGGFSIQRGPLSECANRVVVTYQLLDTSTGEAHEQKRTAAANNTDSQAKYGIQQQVYAAGAITTARAQQMRAAYLLRDAWPRMPKVLALPGSSIALTLSCRGYYHWLNYPYRLANVTGTTTVSAKITAMLAADPNGFFATGLNQIATNTVTVPQLEDQDRTAAEIIADNVALGDATYQRYLFGVWAERAVRYEAAPTAAAYQWRMDGPRQLVEDTGGSAVQPWAVRPGHWVTYTSMAPGALLGLNLAGMPESERTSFIEQVRFAAPASLTLNGGTVNSSAQMLAQWGLAGV